MNISFKQFIAGALTTAIISTGILAPLNRANAQFGGIVFDPSNFVQSTLSAVSDVDIQLKEFVLDGLAKSVANAVATQMKNSIVTWINSGFEGNPAFITDLNGFLLDVGDSVAADFIQTLDSDTQSLICSPFRADIKYSLTIEYYSATSGKELDRCGLDEIFENADQLDSFLSGNFSDGGWDGWFTLTTKPNNNPYGSYLQARGELNARVNGQKIQEKTQLDWANGFLSKKVCGDDQFKYEQKYGGQAANGNSGYAVDPNGDIDKGTDCIIVTPGKAIEDTLSDVLGSDLRDLELADEFNEIVSALVAQLAKEVVTGANGLLGTSKPQGNNRESFLDRVNSAQQQQSQAATGSTAQERISGAISNENQYKETKTLSFERVLSADSALKSLEACLANKTPTDALYTASFAFASSTRSQIQTASSTLSAAISSANTALGTLNELSNDVGSARTTADLQTLLTTLQNLEMRNEVHNGQDVVSAARENSDISKKMDAAAAEANTRRSTCVP